MLMPVLPHNRQDASLEFGRGGKSPKNGRSRIYYSFLRLGHASYLKAVSFRHLSKWNSLTWLIRQRQKTRSMGWAPHDGHSIKELLVP